MTKRVRVENADTSDYKVVVQVWDKGATMPVTDPQTGEVTQVAGPDRLVNEIRLDHPTAITGDDCYIHGGRYLVVKEA